MQSSVERCPTSMPLATLSAWRDHELDAATAQQVQQHVATCPACQSYLAAYEADGRTIRDFAPPQMQDAIWSDVTFKMPAARSAIPYPRLLLGGIGAALAVTLVFLIVAIAKPNNHGAPITLAPGPTSTATGDTNPTATLAETPTTNATVTTTPEAATATNLPQPTATPKAAVSMKEVSQSLAITDSSAMDYSVSASCPTGQTMLGGGYSIVGDSNAQKAILLASYPATTNTWTVTETNSAGGAMTLTAYAECLSSNIPFTVEIEQGVSGAQCAGNAVVTGGGFKQDHTNASLVELDGHTGGNWWSIRQYQSSGSLMGYAICIAPDRFTTNEKVNEISLNSGDTGSTTAPCPSGQIVTGGGYGRYDTPQINYNYVLSDHASSDGTGWSITVANIGGPTPGFSMDSDVQCLSITS